jgi:hypothetical protein
VFKYTPCVLPDTAWLCRSPAPSPEFNNLGHWLQKCSSSRCVVLAEKAICNRVVRSSSPVAPYSTSKTGSGPTSTFSGCEQSDRTTASRVVLAAWLPLYLWGRHGDAAPADERHQSEPGRGTFRANSAGTPSRITGLRRCARAGAKAGALSPPGGRSAPAVATGNGCWNQRFMDVSLIAKTLIFEFNES